MQHKFEPFQKVLVRDKMKDEWQPDLFRCRVVSGISGEHIGFKCIGCGTYKYCIPYEGNENLLGTTDSPEPKHEYKWGEVIEVSWAGQWRKALYNRKGPDNFHFIYFRDDSIRVYNGEIRPLKEE